MSLGSKVSAEFARTGTLARASVTGAGALREVLEDVQFADWSPDGRELAIVRTVVNQTRLEFPIGKVLYETAVDRRSARLAATETASPSWIISSAGDDSGAVAIVDRAGKKTIVSPVFGTARGLAWSPDGSEIWLSAADVGGNRALLAATPSGRVRVLFRGTGALTVADVSRDGRVLLIDEARRLGLSGLAPGAKRERDFSWLDWSRPVGLSRDGEMVLSYESGEGGGPGYSAYVRGMDGSPAVRLGEGQGVALSPDGTLVVGLLHKLTDAHLLLYPTGAGQPRPLSTLGFALVGVGSVPSRRSSRAYGRGRAGSGGPRLSGGHRGRQAAAGHTGAFPRSRSDLGGWAAFLCACFRR